MKNKGVVYVANSEEYLIEAEVSARQLKRTNPSINISVLTNRSTNFEFDKVIPIPSENRGFEDKIRYLTESPYDQTLFLDSDTYVIDDISNLFELLDSYQIGFCIERGYKEYQYNRLPNCYPEYNTGVLLYRNDKEFDQFSEIWLDEYKKLNKHLSIHDQPAFALAVYKTKINFVVLPQEFNFRFTFGGYANSKIKILHGRISTISARRESEPYAISNISDIVNKYSQKRLISENGSRGVTIRYVNPEFGNYFTKIRISLKYNGLRTTINYITSKLTRKISDYI